MAISANNLSKELDSLKTALRHRGYPFDKEKNYIPLLSLTPAEPPDSRFAKLIRELFRQTVGGRTNESAEELKRHWGYFLFGLSGSVLTHKWLTVYLKKSEYDERWSTYMKSHLAYEAINVIVGYLKENELVMALNGAPHESHPELTRIYPTPRFASLILPFYLNSRESFRTNYLQIFRDGGNTLEKIDLEEEFRSFSKSHPDKKDLERINDFLKEQQWACSGPIALKYRNTRLEGGRLYTRYQELPVKTHRIRINTLINGEPIYELVFDANHLRLAMAVLHRQDIGDTPYEDVMWLADIKDKDLIQSFVTIAIEARNRDQAYSRWNLSSYGRENFIKIENALKKRFPELKLYNDWSSEAENIERAILKDVMLTGIEKDILALPVNNSLAVQQRHESWAVDSMLESWDKHVVHGQTRLKVDRP